jgi:hypothetical protein
VPSASEPEANRLQPFPRTSPSMFDVPGLLPQIHLTNAHTGTAGNQGKVRIGFQNTGLTSFSTKMASSPGSPYASPSNQADGEVSAFQAGDLILRVRDTGVSIPGELLPHIFDMFIQGQPITGGSAGRSDPGMPYGRAPSRPRCIRKGADNSWVIWKRPHSKDISTRSP